MTMHIDLTINGDTILRVAVHNCGPAPDGPGCVIYRWTIEPRIGERRVPATESGTVSHRPEQGAAMLGMLVLAAVQLNGGVPCLT